jgi:hypothetical protein
VSGWNYIALLTACACSSGGGAHGKVGVPKEHAPTAELAAVPPADLCVTHGHIAAGDRGLAIDEAVRAVAPGTDGDAVGLRFTYRGPSSEETKLKSGEVRRQVGLKLKAEDGCNLVYVMWRLSPKPGLEVSVKRNPGDHDNDECGTSGYTKIRPSAERPISVLENDKEHVLQAEIHGDALTAWVDGKVAWEGTLTSDARDLSGPAGLRADNMQLDAELLATGHPTDAPECPDSATKVSAR